MSLTSRTGSVLYTADILHQLSELNMQLQGYDENVLKVHEIYSIREILSFQLLTFMIFKNIEKVIDAKN